MVAFRLYFHPSETEPSVSTVEGDYSPLVYESSVKSEFHQGDEYYTRTYSFHFNHSYAYTPLKYFNKSKKLGYHEHDIERIMIYSTDLEQNDIRWVYFCAHSRGQGQWVEWNQCQKTEQNQLIVYVARGSHALYPKKDIYLRIFGFANDHCSDHGIQQDITITSPSFDWRSHNGIFMTSGPHPYPGKNSATLWKRFFLPFYVNDLRFQS